MVGSNASLPVGSKTTLYTITVYVFSSGETENGLFGKVQATLEESKHCRVEMAVETTNKLLVEKLNNTSWPFDNQAEEWGYSAENGVSVVVRKFEWMRDYWSKPVPGKFFP